MNEMTYNQLFEELDSSLKKSLNQFKVVKKNDLENLRKDFFEFGELEIDRILKEYQLKMHQIDGKVLNQMRNMVTMQMIEIN